MATRNKVRGVQVNEWLEALQRQTDSKVERVPPEWYRIEAIAKIFGRSTRITSARLKAMVENGLAERKQFVIISGDSGVQSVWHFRLKK